MSCVLRSAQGAIPAENRKAVWDSLEQNQEGRVFGLWTTEFFKKAIRDER